MRIFRVIGLGLAIIVFKFLVPAIFHSFEKTLLVFFDFAQHFIINLDQGLVAR